jgi:hypothetical protein
MAPNQNPQVKSHSSGTETLVRSRFAPWLGLSENRLMQPFYRHE